MKNYFSYYLNEVSTYLELNNNVCERAVFQKNNQIINSYSKVEKSDFILPEGDLSESIKYYQQITKSKFDSYWRASIEPSTLYWNKFKKKHKIGEIVVAKIVCFYPQGIISNFGASFYGLSNFEECFAYYGSDKMYPNKFLNLKVLNFDNENHIVHLKI